MAFSKIKRWHSLRAVTKTQKKSSPQEKKSRTWTCSHQPLSVSVWSLYKDVVLTPGGFWTCLGTFSKCFEVQGRQASHCQVISWESLGQQSEPYASFLCLPTHQDLVSHRLSRTVLNFGSRRFAQPSQGPVLQQAIVITISPLASRIVLMAPSLWFIIVTQETRTILVSLVF